MFKSDAKLFLSANNNINSAKSLINDCIRLLSEAVLPESSDYNSCKSNLENSEINILVNKVDDAKESLMRLDQGFANEYMSLLQEFLQTSTIDTSNMSDEEKMQYNIEMNAYTRDYNQTLLYMLEKYEESGMLIPELEAMLQMQKAIVEQYNVQDKMASLPTASEEYIKLFQENAEYDKEIIKLNPNLTTEEKNSYLEQYKVSFNANMEALVLRRDINVKNDELKKLADDGKYGTEEYYSKQNEIYQLQIDFYNNKDVLTDEEKTNLYNLNNYKELNELYIEKAGLGSNWIPFDGNSLDDEIFSLKKEMGIATQDELEYLDMDGWEKALHNAGTFVTSTFEGIYNIEESLFDGCVMVCGGIGSVFGADTKWAEDLVEIDLSGDAYRGVVLNTGLNENIAYGQAHTAGNFTGEMLATIALQFLPGGNVVMMAAHGLKGMGSAAEKALKSGKDFGTSFLYGAATGTVEAGASYLLYGKVGKGTNTSKVLDKFGSLVTKGINKIPGVSKVAGVVSGGFNKVASAGIKSYAKAVFKPGLVAKFIVAGGKEYAKEGVSVIIDGEYNFKKATQAATQSMAITAFNEFVISPLVNAVTNKNGRSDKIKEADKNKEKLERKLAEKEKKLTKLEQEKLAKQAEQDAKEAVSSKNDIRNYFNGKHTTSSYDQAVAVIEKSKDRISIQLSEVYKNITFRDRLISSGFVTKFAAKASSNYIQKNVFS